MQNGILQETGGVPSLPADDEWFDLEVDYEDPMTVVVSAGCDSKGWNYLGPRVPSGRRTIRVKLVRVGRVENLAEARNKIDRRGDYQLVFLEGQAREAFKKRFPKPDGKGPVVFGGSRWQDRASWLCVATLVDFKDEWGSNFSFDGLYTGGWRWPVRLFGE